MVQRLIGSIDGNSLVYIDLVVVVSEVNLALVLDFFAMTSRRVAFCILSDMRASWASAEIAKQGMRSITAIQSSLFENVLLCDGAFFPPKRTLFLAIISINL